MIHTETQDHEEKNRGNVTNKKTAPPCGVVALCETFPALAVLPYMLDEGI